MNITDLTEKQLESELKRRRNLKILAEVPQPLDVIDTTKIREFAISTRDEVSNGNIDEDTPHWAYELIMESVFGKDYWKWANKQ